MKMNKILLGFVGVGAALTLAACGSSSSSNKDAKVDAIKSAKVLKVALSPDYPPFEYQTIKDGKNEVVGADVDLANAIGKELGVKVEVSTMDFNNVLASLSSGKADLAISGISATEERKNAFAFSDVYYTAANQIVIKKADLNKYASLSDFEGKKLAAQKGSTMEIAVKDQVAKANLVSLPANGDAINEVKTGVVAGAVLEDMIAKNYVAANPDLVIAPAKIPNLKSNPGMAVAMKKGAGSLSDKVNKVIKELKSSGELDKIIQDNYKESQTASK